MPSAYQSTGLAFLVLLLIWVYRLTESSHSSLFDLDYGTDDQPDAIVVTHTAVVVPVATSVPEPSQSEEKVEEPVKSSKPLDRPLISYAYSESTTARENIQFFLSQGLHDNADFVFILNGETDIATLIPEKDNIKIVTRPNECFDLGAHGEVLRKDDLWKKYKRFITLNASLRGPFIPYWSDRCWSDVFLNKITDEVKLVGMTANCSPQYHIQSMIWATDSVGLELLLSPPPGSSVADPYGEADDLVAMQGCYKEFRKAIHGEVGATGVIQRAGYKVDALMAAFHKAKDYQEECVKQPMDDILWNGRYYGSNVHPYETVFMKANRDIDPTLLKDLSEWHLQGTFRTSYDLCR